MKTSRDRLAGSGNWTGRAVWLASIASALLGTTSHAQTIFDDDFQDGNADGWAFFTTNTASPWEVMADSSVATDLVLAQGSNTNNEAYATAGEAHWQDYSVEARVKLRNVEPYPGLLARYQDNNNYYMLRINKVSEGRVEFSKKVGGASTIFASYPFATTADTWYTLRIAIRGNVLRGYLNGNALFEVVDSALDVGKIGFRTNWGTILVRRRGGDGAGIRSQRSNRTFRQQHHA